MVLLFIVLIITSIILFIFLLKGGAFDKFQFPSSKEEKVNYYDADIDVFFCIKVEDLLERKFIRGKDLKNPSCSECKTKINTLRDLHFVRNKGVTDILCKNCFLKKK